MSYPNTLFFQVRSIGEMPLLTLLHRRPSLMLSRLSFLVSTLSVLCLLLAVSLDVALRGSASSTSHGRPAVLSRLVTFPPRPSLSFGDMVHRTEISLGAIEAASLLERTGESEGCRRAVADATLDAAVDGRVDSDGASEKVGDRRGWVAVVSVANVKFVVRDDVDERLSGNDGGDA